MKTVSYMEDEIPQPTMQRKAELRALSGQPDSGIDYSDIPQLDDDFWKRAVLWKDAARSGTQKPVQVAITAKLDADVVAWLKKQGRGYQTRMNAILRNAMLHSQ